MKVPATRMILIAVATTLIVTFPAAADEIVCMEASDGATIVLAESASISVEGVATPKVCVVASTGTTLEVRFSEGCGRNCFAAWIFVRGSAAVTVSYTGSIGPLVAALLLHMEDWEVSQPACVRSGSPPPPCTKSDAEEPPVEEPPVEEPPVEEPPVEERQKIMLQYRERKVQSGSEITLPGEISGTSGCTENQAVELQQRRPGEDRFATVATTRSTPAGSFEFRVVIERSAQYRAVAPESSACREVHSGVVSLRAVS